MHTTRLLIARHGNTFDPGEPPRRVGARTDLPLSESGREQAIRLGHELRAQRLLPAAVITSRLQRTRQTAALALGAAGHDAPQSQDARLNEIDYGPDENQPESAVRARIGQEALERWNREAAPPPGWHADPARIAADWRAIAAEIVTRYAGQTALIVTSNGIARFATQLATDTDIPLPAPYPTLRTGALSCLEHDGTGWHIRWWNRRPDEALASP